jgi:hypothetical protein
MDERVERATRNQEAADYENMTDLDLLQDSALLRQQIKEWLKRNTGCDPQSGNLLERAIAILNRFEYQAWIEIDDGK